MTTLPVGQRVRLATNPSLEGEVGAVDRQDGTSYFVMWDDGYGQPRGLPRPATIETPLTIRPIEPMTTDPEDDHAMTSEHGATSGLRRIEPITSAMHDREQAQALERKITDLLAIRTNLGLVSSDVTVRAEAELARLGVPAWARGARVTGLKRNLKHPIRRQWVVEATGWKR